MSPIKKLVFDNSLDLIFDNQIAGIEENFKSRRIYEIQDKSGTISYDLVDVEWNPLNALESETIIFKSNEYDPCQMRVLN